MRNVPRFDFMMVGVLSCSTFYVLGMERMLANTHRCLICDESGNFSLRTVIGPQTKPVRRPQNSKDRSMQSHTSSQH